MLPLRRILSHNQRGVALPELLVGVFVLATLTTAVIGLATLGTRTALISEQRTVAQGIANRWAEVIRMIAVRRRVG